MFIHIVPAGSHLPHSHFQTSLASVLFRWLIYWHDTKIPLWCVCAHHSHTIPMTYWETSCFLSPKLYTYKIGSFVLQRWIFLDRRPSKVPTKTTIISFSNPLDIVCLETGKCHRGRSQKVSLGRGHMSLEWWNVQVRQLLFNPLPLDSCIPFHEDSEL